VLAYADKQLKISYELAVYADERRTEKLVSVFDDAIARPLLFALVVTIEARLHH
jgi:hypothetical protein